MTTLLTDQATHQATDQANQQTTLSLTEAAQALGLAPQTVRRRIKRGEIPGRLENGPRGLEYRIPTAAIADLPAILPEADQASQNTQAYSAADQGYQVRGQARVIKTRLSLSPPAAGFRTNSSESAPAEGQTGTHSSHLVEEISFLRAQLDVRAEEIRRHSEAEAELRRLLLTSQQLAHELAQQLEQKALPPGPETFAAKKRRVRWWWWKRS